MINQKFKELINQYFDTDTDFLNELKKINSEWDKSKLSRIKRNIQIPKITDVNDVSIVFGLPLEEISKLFIESQQPTTNKREIKEYAHYQKINDAAKTLGISKTTLRKWVVDNKIPYVKAGQYYLIDIEGTLSICRSKEEF